MELSSELIAGIVGAVIGGILSLAGSLWASNIAEERRAESEDHAVLLQVLEILKPLARRSLKQGEPTYVLKADVSKTGQALEAIEPLLYRLRSKRGRKLLLNPFGNDFDFAEGVVTLQEKILAFVQPKFWSSYRKSIQYFDREVKSPGHITACYDELDRLAEYLARRAANPLVTAETIWEATMTPKEADDKIFALVKELEDRGDIRALQAWRQWQNDPIRDIGVLVTQLRKVRLDGPPKAMSDG